MQFVVFYKYDILVKKNKNDDLELIEEVDFLPLKLVGGIEILYQDDEITIAQLIKLDAIAHYQQLVNIRPFLGNFSLNLVDKIIYHQQLANYYNSHKYCRMCGCSLIKRDTSKFVYCNSCNTDIYPQISPCIIVRIEHENKILMSRGVGFPKNRWGLIAGFVEIGETLEHAVKREVMEEVGIEIQDIQYWGSQPWVFPNNTLMVGYTANYKSGEIKIDYNELEDAGFFNIENIPGLPSSNISIAHKMIDDFILKSASK
jgi:NAD+ diphosphatase